MYKETFLAMNEVDAVSYHCVSRVVDRSGRWLEVEAGHNRTSNR